MGKKILWKMDGLICCWREHFAHSFINLVAESPYHLRNIAREWHDCSSKVRWGKVHKVQTTSKYPWRRLHFTPHHLTGAVARCKPMSSCCSNATYAGGGYLIVRYDLANLTSAPASMGDWTMSLLIYMPIVVHDYSYFYSQVVWSVNQYDYSLTYPGEWYIAL